MESILSMHDEVYPLKSRRIKSSSYISNSLHRRRSTLNNNNNTNVFALLYEHIKKMIAQRTIYILGVLNLILAGIAILCVAQAEDHPEYFSLVYISISIFIFYMATIILIIILQIIETYQEHHQRNHPSLSIQMPVLSTQITTQSKPTIVESMTTKTQAKTSLSRSHTLPLTSSLINPNEIFSKSTHLELMPKNYQSFALTTNDQFYAPYRTITNSDSTPYFSTIIKPIPVRYHINNKSNTRILQY